MSKNTAGGAAVLPPPTLRRCLRGAGRLASVTLAVMALGAAGCQRRTDIVLIPADSSRTAALDSSAVALRETQQMWESGANLESASAATSRLLAGELGSLPAEAWHDRASYMLDSLGVGAEFAEARGALAVNFFSRSDPEGGSWPYLFWATPKEVVSQALEGRGLHLQGIIARGLGPAGTSPADSVRLLSAAFSRRAPGGLQPLVMTWSMPPKGAPRWNLVQTLGPDSLGTYGTAGFESASDTGAVLMARTYRTPRGFVECVTCPHAYSTTRFRWTPQGFMRVETRSVPSPYATFAEFIAALTNGDRVAASERVSDPALVFDAQRLGWSMPKGGWRPAPGADESPGMMTFLRGPKEAYTVRFRPQGDGWVITGFEAASRNVE